MQVLLTHPHLTSLPGGPWGGIGNECVGGKELPEQEGFVFWRHQIVPGGNLGSQT